MKRIVKQVGLISLFGCLLILIFAKPVFADGDYEITKFRETLNVQKDGSVDVRQVLTYKFADNMNGVYISQNRVGIDSLKNIEMGIVNNNGSTIQQFQRSASGNPKSYEVIDTGNTTKIKAYNPVKDGTTISYYFSFKMKGDNLIRNYADSGELYYTLFKSGDDGAAVNINDMKITVNFPKVAGVTLNKGNFKSWTHGPLMGHQAVNYKDNQVVMILGQLNAGTMLDTRILYPTALTPNNTSKQDSEIKAQILKEEADNASKANRSRFLKWVIALSIPILSMLLALFVTVRTFILARKKTPKIKMDIPYIEHLYEIPKNVSPAIMAALLNKNGHIDEKALTATLIDLAGRKIIEIKEVSPRTILKKANFSFTRVIPLPSQKILPHEIDFINWLFGSNGLNDTVTTEQIAEKGRKSEYQAKLFTNGYKDWQELVKTSAKKEDWRPDQEETLRNRSKSAIWVNSIMIWPAVCGFAFFSSSIMTTTLLHIFVMMLIIIILLFIFSIIFYFKHFPVYTEYGANSKMQWEAFERMLKDISHLDAAKVGDVILWEQILPYATALGISKEVISALELQFTPEQLSTMGIGYIYFGNPNIGQSFTGGIESAISSSISSAIGSNISGSNTTSSSGGGGGFSSGGGGGAGGGGAGAF